MSERTISKNAVALPVYAGAYIEYTDSAYANFARAANAASAGLGPVLTQRTSRLLEPWAPMGGNAPASREPAWKGVRDFGRHLLHPHVRRSEQKSAVVLNAAHRALGGAGRARRLMLLECALATERPP